MGQFGLCQIGFGDERCDFGLCQEQVGKLLVSADSASFLKVFEFGEIDLQSIFYDFGDFTKGRYGNFRTFHFG